MTLRTLRGEFQLSAFELILPSAVGLLSIGGGAVLLSLAFGEKGESAAPFEKGILSLIALAFVAGGAVMIYGFRVRYSFEGGTLRVVLPGGYVFRRYDLRTLHSVTCAWGRAVDTLTLRWPDQKHRILLPTSLQSALAAAAPASNSRLERP